LVDNSLLHNGALVGPYPQINNPPKYQVGEKLTMILNKDQNILYFEKNGEFLGNAFEFLPPVNNRCLF
jgi:F-box protein 45